MPLGLLTVTVTLLVAGLGWLLWPVIANGDEIFGDFVAGTVALDGVYKSAEFYLADTLLAATLLLSALAAVLPRAISQRRRINDRLVLLAGVLLGVTFLRPSALTAVAAIAALTTSFSPVEFRRLFYRLLIGVVCLVLILLEISTVGAIDLSKHIIPTIIVTAAILLITHGLNQTICRTILNTTQILSPLLLLRFSQLSFIHPNTTLTAGLSFTGMGALYALLILLIYYGYREVNANGGVTARVRILGTTAASFAALLSFYPAVGTPQPEWGVVASLDEYHLGEMLLPWQQIVEFGSRAYSDFMPTQGLNALAVGAILHYGFDGNLQAYPLALMLPGILVAIIVTLSISRIVNPFFALLLAPVAVPFFDRYYFVAIALTVLLTPNIWKNLLLWYAVALLLLIASLYWQAASAVALGVAIVSTVLFRFFYNRPTVSEIRGLAGISAVALAVLLMLPTIDLLSFISENAATNTAAHAKAYLPEWVNAHWFPKYLNNPTQNVLIWELFRIFGWLVAISPVTYLAVKKRNDGRLFFAASFAITLSVVLIPYALGRVDPVMYLTRAGSLSMLMLGLFLPLTYCIDKGRYNSSATSALIVGVLMGIPVGSKGGSLELLFAIPSKSVAIPERAITTDVQGFSVFAFPETAEILKDLQTLLSETISEGESFVDLTNRTSFHFLLNRRYPLPYAPVVAVNHRQQLRMIDEINRKAPPVAIIAPELVFERSPTAIRSYWVVKEFLTRGYQVVTKGSVTALISPDRIKERGINTQPTEILEQLWLKEDLESLPLSWGRSSSSLLNLVRSSEVKIKQNGATSASINVGSGPKADFLLLQFSGPYSIKDSLTVDLATKSQPSTRPFKMRLAAETLIIPLGNNPLWWSCDIEEIILNWSNDSLTVTKGAILRRDS